MNFGKYAILTSVKYNFQLEPQWYWEIKPVSSGMELERSKFLLHNRTVQDAQGNRRDLPPTWLEIAHREIALTFAGTNIPEGEKPVEDGGKPILEVGASPQEIERVLRNMPQEMVWEIWVAVGNSYPEWGPANPNPKRAPEETD